jgi:hypothetical protein
LFFDNGHHHIKSDCNPDLGFDGILGGSIECFDTKVRFDPFEEYLNLPATLKSSAMVNADRVKSLVKKISRLFGSASK